MQYKTLHLEKIMNNYAEKNEKKIAYILYIQGKTPWDI